MMSQTGATHVRRFVLTRREILSSRQEVATMMKRKEDERYLIDFSKCNNKLSCVLLERLVYSWIVALLNGIASSSREV